MTSPNRRFLILALIITIIPIAIGAASLAAASTSRPELTGVTNATSAGSSLTLQRPSGVSAGDAMVAVVAARFDDSKSMSAPAGWSQVRRDSNSDGASLTQVVFVRVATSSEPGSWTWTLPTSTASAGAILGYRGTDAANPIAGSSGRYTADSSAIVAPSVDAPAGSVVIALFSNNSNRALTSPSGFSGRVSTAESTGSLTVALAGADASFESAGSTGNKTSQVSVGGAASSSIGQLVVVRGGSASGGDTSSGSTSGGSTSGGTTIVGAPAGASGTPSTAAPALTITTSTPAANATVRGVTQWQVETTGSVQQVDFYVDGRRTWRDRTAPWIYRGGRGLDTGGLTDGTHQLQAVAIGAGNATATTQVAIQVANVATPSGGSGPGTPVPTPPTSSALATTTPANNATISGSVQWRVELTGAADRVDFFIDGEPRWTERHVPYVFNGDSGALNTHELTDGSHVLKVVATKSDGTSETTQVTVTVSNGTGGGTGSSGSPPPPSSSGGGDLYAGSSPFNTLISSGAAVDPSSASMVQSLVTDANAQGFIVASGRWTVPVYHADASTPRKTFNLTAGWAPARTMSGVPVPANASPDPDGDGHMLIIDRSTGCEYDFWQAKKSSSGAWSASWGNTLLTSGTGVYPKGLSARGSGFGLGAGLIMASEIASGQINHALVFSYRYTKSGGPVLPATESDGTTTSGTAIPEGARVQLDPSLDLDSLGLTPWQKTIARALQRYGMILADTGGGVSLYAQHPQSTSLTYPWGNESYPALPKSLVSKMRVLKLSAQYKATYSVAATPCATMK